MVKDKVVIPYFKLTEWMDKLKETLGSVQSSMPLVLEVVSEMASLMCRECQVLSTIGKKCDLHA
jgi:hypothetical protein